MSDLLFFVFIAAAITLLVVGEIRAWPGSYKARRKWFEELRDGITPESIREFIAWREQQEENEHGNGH